MTNWSTEDLRNLKEMTNHKVVYDGYEFVWLSKRQGKWNRHYTNNFEDYNKPMSWIHHHVYNWGKEYRQRHAKYLDDMRTRLDIDIKITEISREANTRTKIKINQILKLKPILNNQQIADILGVTIRTIRRIRNE